MREPTRMAASRLVALALGLVATTGARAQVPDALPTPDPGQWGTIRGRVVYGGDPPRSKILADPADPTLKGREVIARRGPIRSERLVVDPATRGVRDAFVHLDRPAVASERARGNRPRSVTFRGDRGVFVPHALALMDGAEVVVETADPILYNARGQIRGGSLIGSYDGMNLKRGGQVRSVGGEFASLFGDFNVAFGSTSGRSTARIRPRAGRGEPDRVVGDGFPWMTAWWLVLDHPYFAVTDERGEFTIEDAPAGRHHVSIWHEDGQGQRKLTREVEVVAGRATTLDLTLDPSAFPPD